MTSNMQKFRSNCKLDNDFVRNSLPLSPFPSILKNGRSKDFRSADFKVLRLLSARYSKLVLILSSIWL